MQSFDDVFFTMTPFYAKKSEKTKVLGEKKNLKAQNGLKSPLIMFFSDIQPVIKKIFAFISENWKLMPN